MTNRPPSGPGHWESTVCQYPSPVKVTLTHAQSRASDATTLIKWVLEAHRDSR